MRQQVPFDGLARLRWIEDRPIVAAQRTVLKVIPHALQRRALEAGRIGPASACQCNNGLCRRAGYQCWIEITSHRLPYGARGELYEVLLYPQIFRLQLRQLGLLLLQLDAILDGLVDGAIPHREYDRRDEHGDEQFEQRES